MKNILKKIMPSALLDFYYSITNKKNTYRGNFTSWSQALTKTTGYDSNKVIRKIKEAALQVKNKSAVYERDSVLFDSIQYSWPILCGLLWIASLESQKLNVLDFGGGLGSSFYQNLMFLEHLNLRWNIVEQEKLAEIGKESFQNDMLFFYHSVEDCFNDTNPKVALLSSVMPYLPQPYDILENLISQKIPYLIFDRTPFFEKNLPDRITIQRVPKQIYSASYPAHIFNLKKFKDFLYRHHYELITEFDSLAGSLQIGHDRAQDKGFIYQLKK